MKNFIYRLFFHYVITTHNLYHILFTVYFTGYLKKIFSENYDSLNGFSKALIASGGGAITQTWHHGSLLLVSVNSKPLRVVVFRH